MRVVNATSLLALVSGLNAVCGEAMAAAGPPAEVMGQGTRARIVVRRDMGNTTAGAAPTAGPNTSTLEETPGKNGQVDTDLTRTSSTTRGLSLPELHFPFPVPTDRAPTRDEAPTSRTVDPPKTDALFHWPGFPDLWPSPTSSSTSETTSTTDPTSSSTPETTSATDPTSSSTPETTVTPTSETEQTTGTKSRHAHFKSTVSEPTAFLTVHVSSHHESSTSSSQDTSASTTKHDTTTESTGTDSITSSTRHAVSPSPSKDSPKTASETPSGSIYTSIAKTQTGSKIDTSATTYSSTTGTTNTSATATTCSSTTGTTTTSDTATTHSSPTKTTNSSDITTHSSPTKTTNSSDIITPLASSTHTTNSSDITTPLASSTHTTNSFDITTPLASSTHTANSSDITTPLASSTHTTNSSDTSTTLTSTDSMSTSSGRLNTSNIASTTSDSLSIPSTSLPTTSKISSTPSGSLSTNSSSTTSDTLATTTSNVLTSSINSATHLSISKPETTLSSSYSIPSSSATSKPSAPTTSASPNVTSSDTKLSSSASTTTFSGLLSATMSSRTPDSYSFSTTTFSGTESNHYLVPPSTVNGTTTTSQNLIIGASTSAMPTPISFSTFTTSAASTSLQDTLDTNVPPTTTPSTWVKHMPTSTWLPTVIVTASESEIATSSQTLSTADPSPKPQPVQSLPNAINPANEAVLAENYMSITIGFKKELKYAFVASHPVTSAQIFNFLPLVLGFPFGGYPNVTVASLLPLKIDTKDYIATVAEVYFPAEKVQELTLYLSNNRSSLYTSYDKTGMTLAQLIDKDIPLFGLLNKLNVQHSSQDHSKQDTPPVARIGGTLDGIISPNSKNAGVSSNPFSTGKLTGIVIGSICGVTLYIALMVVGIRYYLLRSRGKVELQDNQSFYSITSGSSSDMTTASEHQNLYDDRSLFATANNARMMRASVTPSVKVDNWMDYNSNLNAISETPATHNFVNGKITKISGPISSENSLGWDV